MSNILAALRGEGIIGKSLKGFIASETDGFFGDGSMEIRLKETDEQYNDRLTKSLASAAVQFKDTMKTTIGSKGNNFKTSFKSAAIYFTIRRFILLLLTITLVPYGFYKLIKQ